MVYLDAVLHKQAADKRFDFLSLFITVRAHSSHVQANLLIISIPRCSFIGTSKVIYQVLNRFIKTDS